MFLRQLNIEKIQEKERITAWMLRMGPVLPREQKLTYTNGPRMVNFLVLYVIQCKNKEKSWYFFIKTWYKQNLHWKSKQKAKQIFPYLKLFCKWNVFYVSQENLNKKKTFFLCALWTLQKEVMYYGRLYPYSRQQVIFWWKTFLEFSCPDCQIQQVHNFFENFKVPPQSWAQ